MDRATIQMINDALGKACAISSIPVYESRPPWLIEAAVTHAVIHLHDALQKLKTDFRVDFSDDVEIEGDITDLISRYRNAACHFGSATRFAAPGSRVVFGMVHGAGPFGRMGDVILENTRDDDVAYFYGSVRLLHHRQLHRAVTAGIAKLAEAAQASGYDGRLLTPER